MSKLQQAYKERSKKINKIEKIKELKSPLEAYNELENYAKNGFETITNEDKAYFLKCFGIFEKEKLEGKNSFMLRVRIPGGHLNKRQAKAIGEISKKYAKDHIDITTRQQIELRHLKIEDLPTILKELDSVDITTFQTGVDNIRNIILSPFDGSGEDCQIVCKPILYQLHNIFLKNQDWIGTLPRKFNTAILGNMTNDCNVYGHDCCFVLAKKGAKLGFNVFLGGKVGIQALQTDIFLEPNQVALFYKALIEVFKEYGFRDNRNKNRLYFLIQSVGLQEFIKEVEKRVDFRVEKAGENLVKEDRVVPKSSIVNLKDKRYAVHFCVPSGALSGADMIDISNLIDDMSYVRLSIEQDFFIMGLDEKKVEKIKQSDLYKKYLPYNHVYFKNQIACVGKDGCLFGVISSKAYAKELSKYLHDNVAQEDAKIRLYYSACPKGCGIHGVGDIGLEGCKADKVNVLVGGKVTKEAKEARVLCKSVSLEEAKEIVKKIVIMYKDKKKDNESFEEFDSRFLSKLEVSEIIS